MSEHIRKAARDSIIIFVLMLITGLMGYFIRITLAKNLTVGEYGLFFSIFTLFSFLSLFVDLGLSQGTINKLVEYRVHKKFKEMKNLSLSILYVQLTLAVFFSIGLLLLQSFLSNNYYRTDVSHIMLPFCIYFVTLPLAFFLVNIIYGFGRSVLRGALDTIKNVFILSILIVVFYSFNATIKAPAYAYALANILVLAIYTPIFLKLFPNFFKLKFNFVPADVWKTFKYGMYVTLATMGWMIITQTDTLMLTYFSTLENVGIYQVALPISTTLLLVATAIGTAIYPIFSEFQARKDFEKMSEMTSAIYSYIEIIILPAAIILFVYPEIIINVLFGSKFSAGSAVIQIFALSGPFISLGLINYYVLSAIGKAKKSLKIMLLAALVNLVLNFVLIPFYGIIGAAIASVIAFLIIMIVSTMQLYKIYKFTIPYWKLAKILFCSLMFLLSIHLLKRALELNVWAEMAAVISISGAIYLLLLYMTNTVNKENIKNILKNVRII